MTSRSAVASDKAGMIRQAMAIAQRLERDDDPGCECHATAKAGHGKTHCPCSDGHRQGDAHPSLAVDVSEDGKKVLWHCQVGCKQEAVTAALNRLGLSVPAGALPIKTWDIFDVDGKLRGKHLRQDSADGTKKLWWAGLNGMATSDLLYGLELLKKRPDDPIVICEGEKAADAVRGAEVGYIALGTFGASIVPSLKVLRHLADRRVVLFSDHDDSGHKHIDEIGYGLVQLGNVPTMVVWPDAGDKDDAADFMAAHGREALRTLLDTAVPWTPTAAQSQSSWLPADNDDVLDGDLSPLEPTCMTRADGQRLLYPDRVHDFHGEPETLKSWAAQVAAAQELINGGTVAWIDHESEARDVYGHLLALGVTKDRLRANFIYVRPEEPIDDAVITQLVVILADRKPMLTVIDGENNSLASSGYDPNSNKEVRQWWDRLVRRLQLAKVGAIVLIDHVVKNQQQQGRWAVGAGQKLAGIDGASFGFELIQTFGRGRTGMVKIVLHKDRPGALRGKTAGKTVAILRLTSHEKDGHIDYELLPPPQGEATGAQDGKDWKPTALMERISRVLERATEPMSQRAVEAAVIGKVDYKRHALTALIVDGYVERSAGPGRAFLHKSIRAYHDPEAMPPAGHKFGADL
jgi:hypothetical protein